MQTKTQYKALVLTFFNRLNDIRFVGQLLFVIIVLLVSWSGVKSIQTNYGLQKQITGLKQQNEIQQLQNDNLQLQNQYYNTNQYLELSARQNFGLAVSGEKEIIVPQQVALAHTIDLPNTNSQTQTTSSKSTMQNNIDSWINFFLHRPNTGN